MLPARVSIGRFFIVWKMKKKLFWLFNLSDDTIRKYICFEKILFIRMLLCFVKIMDHLVNLFIITAASALFIFLPDLNRHFPLTEVCAEEVIVRRHPCSSSMLNLAIILITVRHAAGAEQYDIFMVKRG